MNYRGLELKLRKIVEKRLEEGWNIVPGLSFDFRTEQGACCAVGTAITDVDLTWSSEQLGAISERLGIRQAEVLAISDGFERFDLDRSKKLKRLRALGARIRRDYCETE